jgi:hypothetical protein
MRLKMALLAALVWLSPGTVAGELECRGIGCDLGRVVPNVEWKPSSSCFKPSAPFFFASNTQEYNLAVQTFNQWIDEIDLYMSCVRNEAASDLKKMPEIFAEGIKKVQREVSDEVSRTRTNLRLMRP